VIREIEGGVVVTVRVRPRSRRGVGATEAAVVIGVASPPVEGRATEEARRALARALAVQPSSVTLRSGATARTKTFLVAGLSAAEVRQRIARIAGPRSDR